MCHPDSGRRAGISSRVGGVNARKVEAVKVNSLHVVHQTMGRRLPVSVEAPRPRNRRPAEVLDALKAHTRPKARVLERSPQSGETSPHPRETACSNVSCEPRSQRHADGNLALFGQGRVEPKPRMACVSAALYVLKETAQQQFAVQWHESTSGNANPESRFRAHQQAPTARFADHVRNPERQQFSESNARE